MVSVTVSYPLNGLLVQIARVAGVQRGGRVELNSSAECEESARRARGEREESAKRGEREVRGIWEGSQ